MKIDNLIAIRYIFPKHSYNFISFITLLSIIGIIIGNAALISVQSIFNGFQELTLQQIVGIDPHIRIIPSKSNLLSLKEINLLEIRKISEIKSINPVIQSKIIIVHNSNTQVINLQGIEANNILFKEVLPKYNLSGTLSLNNQFAPNTIIIGSALAERLQVSVGQQVQVYTPSNLEYGIRTFSQPKGNELTIGAILNTNIKDYDLTMSFVNLYDAREILSLDINKVSSIDIYLYDFKKTELVKSKISSLLDQNYQILTWKDLNHDLYSIMKFEKLVSFSIVGIIILIALFNLFASLAMTITEKQQDIAIMKAFGASDKIIQKIYLKEGLIIGLFSTLFGIFLGVLFIIGQQNYKWFKIDVNRYIVDAIPVSLNFNDIIIVAIFSILFSLLATIFPAKQATKFDISETLRNE